MRRVLLSLIFLITIQTLTACSANKEGHIKGSITPPSPGVRVTASQNGQTIATVAASSQDGIFYFSLPEGQYNISIVSQSAPFPLIFSNIIVKPGETTIIGPIAVPSPPKGNAVISGRINAKSTEARVIILDGNVERASVAVGPDGKYEIEGLPEGSYTMRVSAPGYAPESASVAVSENQKLQFNIRMFYITALDGVDWERGTIRARGKGLPPSQAPNPTIRRELTKRAALADAQRNMLRIIDMLQVGPGEKLTTFLDQKTYTNKVMGFIQNYRVAAEQEIDGGKMEIEIELPLTGPNGLSSYLATQ